MLFFQRASELCDPSSCKLKCSENVTDEMVQANFDKYYSFVSEDLKRSFLDKLMRPRKAKRARTAANPDGRTNYQYLIFIMFIASHKHKAVISSKQENKIQLVHQNLTLVDGVSNNHCIMCIILNNYKWNHKIIFYYYIIFVML